MNTRRLQVGCTFRYSATNPTAAVFQVRADQTERVQVSDEAWEWDGQAPLHQYRDMFDNPTTRTILPSGVSTLTYSATAQVPDAVDDVDVNADEVPPAELPDDVLVYTLPSRFCLPDVLGQQAWRRFGQRRPGYQRVQDIMDFVHQHLLYTTGSTTATATSVDTFATGLGVCRDFAHLSITFCRAMNIPARYVHGYFPALDGAPIPPVMDFHAWTQVWLDGRWWDFDARWNQPMKGRCIIGKGRDAADVAMSTTYGAPWLQLMTVTCEEQAQAPA
ncbi:transglutaminase-like domain-containing protein [Dermacoccaceae bacterium W4C1]